MTKTLQHLDQDHIWHPYTPLIGASPAILVRSASGVYLHTDKGERIIDAISSWWVNLHGHSRREIVESISTQAKQLDHVIFAGFTHEPAIRLSENLLKILPGNQEKIFFSDDGSTAVEVALKIALQHWHNQGIKRQKLVAFHDAYHGDTFGSMSVGGRGIFTHPFSDHLFETEFIDLPLEGLEESAIEQFRRCVDRGDVAAFIFEPLVQGAAGMRIYPVAPLDKMIAYARSKGVICIADEVLTGFGRTGRNFASDYLQEKPDIIALSKGLTGGVLPLGVTSCSAAIAAPFNDHEFLKTLFHGHSYTANPLACAAANASYELLMHDDCQERIRHITEKHEAFVLTLQNNPALNSARSLGTILSLELRTHGRTSYTSEIRKKIYTYFLSKNILLRPLGNVIYVLPPYVITDDELEYIYRNIQAFLGELK